MNTTPDLIAALRSQILAAPHAELPAIRGQLATLEAELLARLLTRASEQPGEGDEDAGAEAEDRMLTVDEAAARMNQKPQWIRAHQDELHCVKFGRTVRFSEKQLAQLIRRRSYG